VADAGRQAAERERSRAAGHFIRKLRQVKPGFNRRDFLKLAGLAHLSLASPHLGRMLGSTRQNVIVLVFDAWSAYDISLFGYGRKTTPNLDRLAERAVVYHSHFAASNFTTPGTASLLTGTLPWTHRALQLNEGVAPAFVSRNVFGAFPDYYRIAYTHNGWANILLGQLKGSMDELVPMETLMLRSSDGFIRGLFAHDEVASVSWMRNVDPTEERPVYSLFYSQLDQALQQHVDAGLGKKFPRGIPAQRDFSNHFMLETAVDWISTRVRQLPVPFIGYFHLLPPHAPYSTSAQFVNRFWDDGVVPAPKPEDVFSQGYSYGETFVGRTDYDEFILYADQQLGRLYDALESSGLLGNTWLVVTSDHGELFERGLMGHRNATLYQPVLRVPLVIFEPGRQERLDVHALTSAIDLLPTLSHVTGHEIPDWAEGKVLPPYLPQDEPGGRSIYAVQAMKSRHFGPLTRATVALVTGQHKLIYYRGYPELGMREVDKLYDIQADPEEQMDLSASRADVSAELLAQLKQSLAQADQKYID
jgi:arylsulfatase A-like enzyme